MYSDVSLHTGFSQFLDRKEASTYGLTYRPQAKLYNPITLKMTTQIIATENLKSYMGIFFFIAAAILQNFLCMLATLHSQCATAMKTAVII